MPNNFNYPAAITQDEDGRFVITFPDFGWGATDGATLDEALDESMDLLRELISATIREGAALPKPSKCGAAQQLVIPPVQTALQAALHEAFLQAGISQRRFAKDLAVAESEVRRILSPEHPTKASTLENALRHLHRRVTVSIEQAA